MTTIGSLCTGYGGLEMGLQSVLGGRVAWHSEIDPAANAVLAAHYPRIPNLGDLTAVDWASVEPVDWVTAGYPCQPFSHAGQRKGTDDDRHLWPHVADAIRVLRPRNVLLENVAGHLSLGFGRVLGDLAEIGYDAEWTCLRAADVGAPHGRLRVFILTTDADGVGHERGRAARRRRGGPEDDRRSPADTDGQGWQGAEPAGVVGGPDAPVGGGATPTDAESRSESDKPNRRDSGGQQERPLYRAGGGNSGGHSPERVRDLGGASSVVAWGPYEPAIRQWERITGRAAPAPTEPGRTGNPRLAPALVEWLMGLPDGWVTGVPVGRNAQLRCLGNGVVPRQAAAAVRILLDRARMRAAA